MIHSLPLVLVLGLAACVAMVVLVLDYAPDGSVPETSAAVASSEALPFALGGPFALIDHQGRPRGRDDFHGEYTIIYFGYTACPYTCSTAASNIALVLDVLAEGGDDVGALFITIDPLYDTPERLAGYVSKIHPRMVGLTGEAAEIERLQKSFQVHAKEAVDKGGFERLYDHQPLAFLMGPNGDILTLFPPVLPPVQITRIIEGYL